MAISKRTGWPTQCIFLRCEQIHPLQQRKVSAFVDHVKEKLFVKKAVIFGSSVTDACHVGSDVDIYLELSDNQEAITKYFPFIYDLWTNYTVSEPMLSEIQKKGVVVYERKTSG